MRIIRYEDAYYQDNSLFNRKTKTGSLKVFVEGDDGNERFWGYIPKELVQAIQQKELNLLFASF